jgi:hypothetical protein
MAAQPRSPIFLISLYVSWDEFNYGINSGTLTRFWDQTHTVSWKLVDLNFV